MRMRDWKYHVMRLAAALLLATLCGWLSGHTLLVPALFVLAYLVWQFYNSIRLFRWLQSWDHDPPESLGMWSEIFDRINSLQKINRKRQGQYQSVIDDFREMTDALPDATLVIDGNNVITWFNDSAARLLGLIPGEDQGQLVTNLLREPVFNEWLAVQDQVHTSVEIKCPTDHNIRLQVNAVRFRENQRMLVLRDITDIHNLERVRKDLVANVSHELRTPLTVLLGYLEMLQNHPDDPDPAAVGRMLEQARQMRDMLEDLLELSRLQDTDKAATAEITDVPALLSRLGEQARELSGGKHDLHFDIQPGLCLRGVGADLNSAFQNLLTNAIRYTPPGGHIEVRWHEDQHGPVLSVSDSGIGIPHRDIPRITERFYRVGKDRARQTGGTGLGLAIVKHVLNNHQARLEISSEPGAGSVFSCHFPADRKA